MMKSFILACLALTLSVFSGNSQKIELNTKSFYGIWNNETAEYNYGGFAFEGVYEHPLKKGALRTGIEYRSIDWGNQLSLNIGYKAPYIVKDKWELSGITSVGLGLALFVDNSLFVYAIDYTPVFTWLRKKRLDFNIGLGIRFSHSPAYQKYGKINQVLEFPLTLGMQFNLGYKKAPN